MPIPYMAPQHVRDVLAGLGRTEDIRFSPSHRRLAIAGFANNKIALFDAAIVGPSGARKLELTGAAEIFSAGFNHPHGLDFIDEETLIVANRDGNACVLKLPGGKIDGKRYELDPIASLSDRDHLNSPGSVAVIGKAPDLYDALICDNYRHRVTRHRLNLKDGCSVEKSEVLLKRHLDIPDGICVSRDEHWIAISNHSSHSVLIYRNDESLDISADPQGILRGVYYPHGLRFMTDERFMLVADAGSPYVRIYKKEGASWSGVRYPVASYRVMSDETFLRGRYNPQEGGPKGIDLHEEAGIVVTSNEWQPLTFFELEDMLSGAAVDSDAQDALAVAYELDMKDRFKQARKRTHRAERRAKKEKERAASLKKSKSWRLTAPLRWILSSR